MKRPVELALALLLGVVVALPIGAQLGGGERLLYATPSPNGLERVEFYAPPRGRAWLAPDFDLAGTLRLVRVNDAESLSEDSAVVELSEAGEVYWSKDSVQLGTTAVLDRRTRRWDTTQ